MWFSKVLKSDSSRTWGIFALRFLKNPKLELSNAKFELGAKILSQVWTGLSSLSLNLTVYKFLIMLGNDAREASVHLYIVMYVAYIGIFFILP